MTYGLAKWIAAWLLVVVVMVGLAGVPAAAGEKWGPFRGRLVDVETGLGIAGGVVLAVWDRAYPGVAGTVTEFHEAREAVSDAAGLFEMPRLDPPFFSLNVRAPSFTIFAPGYVTVRWVVTPENGEPLVDLTVIEMRMVTTQAELWKKSRTWPSIVPIERIPAFTRAVSIERRMLGLTP